MSKRFVPDRNKVIFNHGSGPDWETQQQLDDLEDEIRHRDVVGPDFSDIYLQIGDLQQQIIELQEGGGGGDNQLLPPLGNLIYWLSGGEGYTFEEDFVNQLVVWADKTGSTLDAYAPIVGFEPDLQPGANNIETPFFDVGAPIAILGPQPRWEHQGDGLEVPAFNGTFFPIAYPDGATFAMVVHHQPDAEAKDPLWNPSMPPNYTDWTLADPSPQAIVSMEWGPNYTGANRRQWSLLRSPDGYARIIYAGPGVEATIDSTALFPVDPCVVTCRWGPGGLLMRINGETVLDDPVVWPGVDPAHEMRFTVGHTQRHSVFTNQAGRFYHWSGSINEVLLYDAALTGPQVIAVENYLVNKFTVDF